MKTRSGWTSFAGRRSTRTRETDRPFSSIFSPGTRKIDDSGRLLSQNL